MEQRNRFLVSHGGNRPKVYDSGTSQSVLRVTMSIELDLSICFGHPVLTPCSQQCDYVRPNQATFTSEIITFLWADMLREYVGALSQGDLLTSSKS